MAPNDEQIEFVVRNTELLPKRAIERASSLILASRNKMICGEDNRENIVGFIGPYASGNSKVVSNFLQVPSVDVAMISPSSTVRTYTFVTPTITSQSSFSF